MPKVAVSYIRFSTPEQSKGNSFRRQIEDSQAWCDRHGYKLDTSLKLNDMGLSGFKGQNAKTGKLKAFLDLLEADKIKADALIIESLDRLSRAEVGDALRLFLNILSHKIKIVTTKPENVFDQKSINDPANLIMAILEICRGFSESNIKSQRVADAWKQKKEMARTGHKVSSRCPGWLKLNAKREFEFVPAKVTAVKRLLGLAKSGLGLNPICKILNQEKHPTLRDHAKHWHASAVLKTLSNRALIGEYQPRFSNKTLSEKHRKTDGDAIQNYYPSLITEAEFYELQAGLQSRRQIAAFGQGRQSTKVANLFSRILKDARTGATLYRVDKGKKSVPYLMSAEAKAGIGERDTFPYQDFEKHFLQWFREISASVFSNNQQVTDAQKHLIVVRGKIQDLTKKLKTLKNRLAEEDEIETLLDLVKELDAKLKKLRAEEELLKADTARPDPTKDTQSVLRLLEKAKGDDLLQLRSKVRFLINELIEVIFVRMQRDDDNRRWLFAQIHFRNGKIRKMSLVAYVVYSGGGATNPVPSMISTSSSTPQQLLSCDLREAGTIIGNLPSLKNFAK